MEQKYLVSLSGSILKDSMAETVESLSSIFLDKQPSEIERLIKNKATIKRAVDLSLANKIKSRIEQAGAECTIALDTQSSPTVKKSSVTEDLSEKNEITAQPINKKEGIIFIFAAVLLAITVVFISKGYEPQMGLLWSINENMWIYSGHPFGCEKPDYAKYLEYEIKGDCSKSFLLTLRTKYFLLGSLFILAFGVGQHLGAFKSCKEYYSDIRRKFTSPPTPPA